MIDMAHDGDNGWPCCMIFQIIGYFLFGFRLLFEADYSGTESKLSAYFFSGFNIQCLVDGSKDPLRKELLNNVFGLDVHFFRELFNGDPFGN